MSDIKNNDLLAAIRNYPFWYHSFDMGNGERIVGWAESSQAIPETGLWTHGFNFYHIPESLAGWSVLDIAGWDGALSFECENRGAPRVVMTNVRNVADSDFALAGRGTLEARRQRQIQAGQPYWFEDGFTSRGAFLMKQWLSSKVEIVYATVYELPQVLDGSFDLVLCCGLLYHLRDPILALQICRKITRKQIIVESMCKPRKLMPKFPLWLEDRIVDRLFPKPMVEYWGNQDDGANWWCFGVRSLKAMMEDAGFKGVEVKEQVGSRCVLVGYV